jgi:hypothetical protein
MRLKSLLNFLSWQVIFLHKFFHLLSRTCTYNCADSKSLSLEVSVIYILLLYTPFVWPLHAINEVDSRFCLDHNLTEFDDKALAAVVIRCFCSSGSFQPTPVFRLQYRHVFVISTILDSSSLIKVVLFLRREITSRTWSLKEKHEEQGVQKITYVVKHKFLGIVKSESQWLNLWLTYPLQSGLE